MQHLLTIGIWLAAAVVGLAQGEGQPNLVPNPGFEEFRVRPLGWYYRGAQFNRVIRYWRSPTAASPDAYNPAVRVPRHWAEKGFGQQEARHGGAMTGLTLYGCADGKPHCREYLQTQLIEALVPGQRYRVSMYVAGLPRGLRCNRLGVAFTPDRLDYEDDRRLDLSPLVSFSQVAQPALGEWTELTQEFTAASTHGYLVIGNFSADADTQTGPSPAQPQLPFAYYYIDDVSLRKVEPIIKTSYTSTLLDMKLQSGESITLRNVYFDTDRDELQPRSFRELDHLVRLMKRYPDFRVRIVGHTDNEGTPEYNEDLSQRRAATVVLYLEEHGIPRHRLSNEGRGQREPVADNATSEGRQLNRRVVAEVL